MSNVTMGSNGSLAVSIRRCARRRECRSETVEYGRISAHNHGASDLHASRLEHPTERMTAVRDKPEVCRCSKTRADRDAPASQLQPTRRRERRMSRFKSSGSMQRFLSTHDAIYNHFNLLRHLISRRNLHQTRAKAFTELFEIVAV